MVKILTIDDNNDNLHLVEALLAKSFPDAKLLFALDGKKGIELCLSELPDVILLDLIMPGMDGFEVCDQLKSDTRVKHIPIIILTAADPDKESRIKALNIGAEVFLTKSIDNSELAAQIKAMLRIKESEDFNRDATRQLSMLVNERTKDLEKELSDRKRTETELRLVLDKLENSRKASLNLMEDLKEEIEERKLAEKALKEAELKYRKLFSEMSNGSALHELIFNESGQPVDYVTEEVNSMFEELLGVKSENVVGKRASEFLPADELKKWLGIFAPVAMTGKSIHYEIYSPVNNKYFEGTAYCPSGKKFAVTFIDITERKLAEESIRENKEKFESIFKLSPYAIAITDEETGIYIDVNDLFEKLSGYSKPEVIGKTTGDLGLWSDSQDRANWLKILRENGFAGDVEIQFMNKERKLIYCQVSSKRIEICGNKCYLSIIQDITERKETQNELYQLSKRNEDLLSAVPNIIMEVNDNNIYTWANKAGMDFFGEDVIGKPVSYYTIGEFVPHQLHVLDGSVRKYYTENWQKRRDGQKRLLSWWFKTLTDESGKVKGALSSAQDVTEQRKAGETIREERVLLKTIVDNLPVALYLKDKECKKILCNPVDLENIGKLESGVIGKTDWDIFPQEVAKHTYEDDINVLHTGVPIINREELIINSAGESRWLLTNKIPHRNQSGEIIGIIGMGLDISKRKLTEEALRESEEKFRTLITQMQPGMAVHEIILDENGDAVNYRILDINPSYEKMMGQKREDLIGKTVLDALPNTDKYWIKKFGHVAITGEPLYYENYSQELQKYFSVVAYRPRKNEFAVIVEDITERKRNEDELEKYRLHLEDLVDERTYQVKRQNIFLRTFIDTIPNPIFIQNADGKYTEVNKAFEKFFELNRDEILGRSISQLTCKDAAIEHNNIDAALLTKRDLKVYESFHINKNGSRIPIMVYKVSFGASDTEIQGVAGHIIDISVQKEMEEKITDALKKEKELNDMKTNFISSASHEFRTPLTTILGSADLLEINFKKWDEERIKKHIGKIQNSVAFMLILLDEVLTISRSDRGKMECTPETINLQKLCEEIIEDIKLHASLKHKIHFEHNNSLSKISADPRLLRQIITNLMSNAVKFSPEGGEIKLNAEYINEILKFMISDEGIGIPKEDIKKLFEPFFRANNAGDIRGSGLGLSIVKNCVEKHKGEISVKSEVGKGSIFTILIKLDTL